METEFKRLYGDLLEDRVNYYANCYLQDYNKGYRDINYCIDKCKYHIKSLKRDMKKGLIGDLYNMYKGWQLALETLQNIAHN